MIEYGIIIIVILLGWSTIYGNPPERREGWIDFTCFLFCMILVIFSAIRGASVGVDTAGYIRDYYLVSEMSFSQILVHFPDNPAYFIVSKIFAYTGLSVQWWFGVVAFLYIYSVTKLIRKFSFDAGLSYIMFVTLGFYAFSLAGLKQTFAMAIVQYAFLFLFDKKYIKFIALVLLAGTFHVSSLVFLLCLVIVVIKDFKYYYGLLTLFFIVWTILYEFLFKSLVYNIGFEHYTEYFYSTKEGGGTLTLFLVFVLIQLVSMIYLKRYDFDDHNEAGIIFGISYIGVLTQILSVVIASSFRVALYFSIYSIILYPNCLAYEFDDRVRRLIKIGSTLMFIFFFWYTNRLGSSIVPYSFFWEH